MTPSGLRAWRLAVLRSYGSSSGWSLHTWPSGTRRTFPGGGVARTTFPAGQGGHWGMVQWGPQPGARPQSQALGTRPPAVGAGVASGFGTWESPAARIHCGRLDGHSWGRLDSHSWGLLEGHSWGPLDSHSWGPWTVTAGAPGRSQLALEESEARSLPGLGPAGSRVAPGLLLSVSLREDNPGDQAPGRGLLSCHPEARRAVRLSKQTEEGSADGSAGGDWRPEQAPRVLFRPVFCGPT